MLGKNIIITAFGTYGDVHPIVAIANNLAEFFEQIIIITSGAFSSLFNNHKFQVVDVFSKEKYENILFSVNLNEYNGIVEYTKKYLVGALEPTFSALLEINKLKPICAVIGTGFINGGAWGAEYLNIPYIKLSLSPHANRGVIAREHLLATSKNPFYKPFFLLFVALASEVYYHRIVKAYLNPIRLNMKMKALKRQNIFKPNQFSTIELYPDWFVDLPGKHQGNNYFTNFPLKDPSNPTISDQTSETVKKCKGRPIIFTVGSATTKILEHVIYAYSLCSALNCDGIFVSPFISTLKNRTFPRIHLIEYADFPSLFSSGMLVIHHGGIGTVAQAIHAEIPQLIRPVAFDQKDNARRVERLGLGLTLTAKHHFSVEQSVSHIRFLLNSKAVTEAIAKYKVKINRDNGLQNATARVLQCISEADIGK